MTKTITIERREGPAYLGYHDRITVIADNVLMHHGDCRSTPNPYKVIGKAREDWWRHYGCITEGKYTWRCIQHDKKGKCISINDRGPVPTINPNPNQGGKMIADGILIHSGQTAIWPGSAGCQTLPPDQWNDFIGCFQVGDSGCFELFSMRTVPILFSEQAAIYQ